MENVQVEVDLDNEGSGPRLRIGRPRDWPAGECFAVPAVLVRELETARERVAAAEQAVMDHIAAAHPGRDFSALLYWLAPPPGEGPRRELPPVTTALELAEHYEFNADGLSGIEVHLTGAWRRVATVRTARDSLAMIRFELVADRAVELPRMTTLRIRPALTAQAPS